MHAHARQCSAPGSPSQTAESVAGVVSGSSHRSAKCTVGDDPLVQTACNANAWRPHRFADLDGPEVRRRRIQRATSTSTSVLPTAAATMMATSSAALPPRPDPVLAGAMAAVRDGAGATAVGAAVGVGATASSCRQTVSRGGGARVTMYLSSASSMQLLPLRYAVWPSPTRVSSTPDSS